MSVLHANVKIVVYLRRNRKLFDYEMGKKLKFAVIALLGFSTACSSSKKSQKSSEPEPQPQPAEVVPRIKVMYGVRPPYPVTVDQAEKLMQEQQSNVSNMCRHSEKKNLQRT